MSEQTCPRCGGSGTIPAPPTPEDRMGYLIRDIQTVNDEIDALIDQEVAGTSRTTTLRHGVQSVIHQQRLNDELKQLKADGAITDEQAAEATRLLRYGVERLLVELFELPPDAMDHKIRSESTCRHCDRRIVNEDGTWIDPEATGDDSIWRETCDAHDTFQAEHEPRGTEDED